MKGIKVEFKEVPPVKVLSLRKTVPKDKILDVLDDLLCWAFDRIIAVGDPHFVIIHKDFGYTVDVEACIPLVDAEIPEEDEEVKVKEIPESNVAFIVHRGAYNVLEEKIKALFEWLREKNIKFKESYRIVYVVDYFDTNDKSKYVTEIQVPIEEEIDKLNNQERTYF
ncbi:MAG TPA: hypothetical protein ENL09_07005 [Bacteroidetes bacterium]|nr:hypothetical protein [Bacteroidota bacterium]